MGTSCSHVFFFCNPADERRNTFEIDRYRRSDRMSLKKYTSNGKKITMVDLNTNELFLAVKEVH